MQCFFLTLETEKSHKEPSQVNTGPVEVYSLSFEQKISNKYRLVAMVRCHDTKFIGRIATNG